MVYGFTISPEHFIVKNSGKVCIVQDVGLVRACHSLFPYHFLVCKLSSTYLAFLNINVFISEMWSFIVFTLGILISIYIELGQAYSKPSIMG